MMAISENFKGNFGNKKGKHNVIDIIVKICQPWILINLLGKSKF